MSRDYWTSWSIRTSPRTGTTTSPTRARPARETTPGCRASPLAATRRFPGEVALWEDPDGAGEGHLGGSLAFGADGKLYISTGENWTPADAQRLDIPRGKILRINKDGTIPTDNPFYDGAGPNRDEIWAYGTAQPVPGCRSTRSRARCTSATWAPQLHRGAQRRSARRELRLASVRGPCGVSGMTNPSYSYSDGGRDASVIGGVVYRGSQFPSEYYGSYFGDYVQHWVRRIKLDGGGNVSQVMSFWPADGSAGHLATGDPVKFLEGLTDRSITSTSASTAASRTRPRSGGSGTSSGTSSRSRWRARVPRPARRPCPSTSRARDRPTPRARRSPTRGRSGTAGRRCTGEPDAHLRDTGPVRRPAHCLRRHQHCVSSDLTIRVGTPPTPTILTPATGTFFRAGDVITYSGSATDAEDGNSRRAPSPGRSSSTTTRTSIRGAGRSRTRRVGRCRSPPVDTPSTARRTTRSCSRSPTPPG